ncbi:polymer-forming cytoskeletal protein [Candidatus Microgenomates bacterium]|nr:polymer-forming cytoskeletal protein [Candidatus Microgenomates bacterium]
MTARQRFEPGVSATVIAKSVQVRGNLACENDLWFDGTIAGNITAGGSVTLGSNAHVQGSINCANLEISGQVKGDVNVKDGLGIGATGQLVGDIRTANLAIAKGAVFIGSVSMPQPAGNNQASKDAANQ